MIFLLPLAANFNPGQAKSRKHLKSGSRSDMHPTSTIDVGHNLIYYIVAIYIKLQGNISCTILRFLYKTWLSQ